MANILLVDDSRSIRLMVSETLRDVGHTVYEAENGEHGVEVASQHALDLVLTDLNMPLMNGIDLTRSIRRLPQHQSTPILLVTTDSQLSKKQEARAAGATGWVVKPIPPQRLLEVVNKVLGRGVPT